MENQIFNINTGDIIITETRFPFINHFGVIVYSGHIINVYHCTPMGNVRIDTLSDFLKNREFKSIRHTGARKVDILRKYEEVKHKEYDLDDFNCIHFAEQLTGK
jgi:hypothetical protein